MVCEIGGKRGEGGEVGEVRGRSLWMERLISERETEARMDIIKDLIQIGSYFASFVQNNILLKHD